MPYQGVMTNCTYWQVRGSSRPSNHQRPLTDGNRREGKATNNLHKGSRALCTAELLVLEGVIGYLSWTLISETGEKRNAKGPVGDCRYRAPRTSLFLWKVFVDNK